MESTARPKDVYDDIRSFSGYPLDDEMNGSIWSSATSAFPAHGDGAGGGGSGSGGGGGSFFDTYYSTSRLSVETVLALTAIFCNALVLFAMRDSRVRRSVYNTLFVNLAVANILSCLLSWISNNLLVLFNRQLMAISRHNICQFFVYLMAAIFVNAAFGLVSTLTMFGFSAVQYCAICRPLQQQYSGGGALRPRRVRAYIAVCWVVSLLAGCAPFVGVLLMTRGRRCEMLILELVRNVVTYGVDVCVGLVAVVYVGIVVLCVRIYRQIGAVRREMALYSGGSGGGGGESTSGRDAAAGRRTADMRSERRAFVTIVTLLATLNVFYVPYMIVHVVSLNVPDSDVLLNDQALIYYMNMLPYMKFTTDPVIYGLRMREVKDAWSWLKRSVCCCCCRGDGGGEGGGARMGGAGDGRGEAGSGTRIGRVTSLRDGADTSSLRGNTAVNMYPMTSLNQRYLNSFSGLS